MMEEGQMGCWSIKNTCLYQFIFLTGQFSFYSLDYSWGTLLILNVHLPPTCEYLISFVLRHPHFFKLGEWKTSIQCTVSCSSNAWCLSAWYSGALQVKEQQRSLLLPWTIIPWIIISFVKYVLKCLVLKVHYNHNVGKIIWNSSVPLPGKVLPAACLPLPVVSSLLYRGLLMILPMFCSL